MAPRASRTLRILRALGLSLPALGLVFWLWARPSPTPSAYEEALDRALAPVLAGRELGTKLGAGSSQVRLAARQAAETSIGYLGPRDLELWQDIRLRVARSSASACARMWQGGSADFFGPAVAALGADALQQYTEMLGRGLALRLERKLPPEPRPGALASALRAIGAALSASERAQFEADLERRDLSDTRACELFVAVGQGSERLDPALRIEFLRALAKELQTPPR